VKPPSPQRGYGAQARVIAPGAALGVLGGSQLGRMFAIAARRMGYRVHTFSPDDDSPTGQVADLEVTASYEDLDALRAFARGVDVVTFEFENVPIEAIDAVEAEEQRCEGVERVGVHILRVALEVPARQIARNAGVDDGPVVEKIRNGSGFFGFDARTKDYAELDERGIIDPTKVVRIALENAVAVAGTLLLAEATMVEIEEEPPAHPPEIG